MSENPEPSATARRMLVGAMYIDRADQLDLYTELMERLCAESLTPVRTRKFLAAIAGELR